MEVELNTIRKLSPFPPAAGFIGRVISCDSNSFKSVEKDHSNENSLA